MARATRTANALLGTSILVGIIAAGCGGGNDNPGTVTAGGGGSSSTGGAATTTGGKANGGATSGATGGSKATGGSAAATGGAPPATGGSKATGGSAAATGGAPPATGGSAAATGGAPPATGGSAAATGGAPPATGGSATVSTGGSAAATGGKSATGGVPATGGAATGGAPTAPVYTGTVPTTFCRPAAAAIPLSSISGSAGGYVLAGSSSGLSITGHVSSFADNLLFRGNVFTCNDAAGNPASNPGFSATNATGTAYTGLSVVIHNNGTTPVVVNITMEDLASAAGTAPYYDIKYLTASVTVPASTTTTSALLFTSFTSPNSLPTGVSIDPHRFLNIGFSIGDAASTYPLNFDVVITSLSFS